MKAFLARLLGQRPNAVPPPLSAAQSAAEAGLTTAGWVWYFAHPIHLEARMEHLVPSADLSESMRPEEWPLLEALLNTHFEGEETRFFLTLNPKPQLYLRVATPFGFNPQPVSAILGRPIASHWPSANEARPHARALARLLNEIQMLFHEQPFNEAREAQDEPPINGLWIWDTPTIPDSLKR